MQLVRIGFVAENFQIKMEYNCLHTSKLMVAPSLRSPFTSESRAWEALAKIIQLPVILCLIDKILIIEDKKYQTA